MTVAEQRDLVAESFRRLIPVRQYIFVVLLLERLFVICRETFPAGLPTKLVPYEDVTAAMDRLWHRVENVEEEAHVSRTSKAWRPLTSTGHLEHRPGAALGFHVAELISTLAATDLHHPLDSILDLAWEAPQTLLFRLPESPDYSQSIIHTDLDPELNRSLLLEYETQRTTLRRLHEDSPIDLEVLRVKSNQTATTIAQREHEYLVRT